MNDHYNNNLSPRLPVKPSISEYGYWEWNKAVPCSREQLIVECSQLRVPDICLVWTPEFETFVPVAQVSYLQAALRNKFKRSIIVNLVSGVFNFLFALLLGFLFVEDIRDMLMGENVFILLWMVLFGITPIAVGINQVIHFKRSLRVDSETMFFRAETESRAVGKRFSETIVYCIVIVILGLLQMPYGLAETIEAGGLIRSAVMGGEYWRVLTCAFLHGGMIHLLMNSWVLLSLGRFMEMLCGRSYLALVYLCSILGSSVASMMILGDKLSIGASGGIMGLFGFIAVMGIRMKSYLPPKFMKSILVNISAIAVIGLIGYRFIDNAAHAGGLITGALLGLMIIPKGQRGFPLQQPRYLIKLGIAAEIVLMTAAVITFFLIIQSH